MKMTIKEKLEEVIASLPVINYEAGTVRKKDGTTQKFNYRLGFSRDLSPGIGLMKEIEGIMKESPPEYTSLRDYLIERSPCLAYQTFLYLDDISSLLCLADKMSYISSWPAHRLIRHICEYVTLVTKNRTEDIGPHLPSFDSVKMDLDRIIQQSIKTYGGEL